MDLLSLQLFLNIEKFHSLAEAARQMSLSPASASARLSRLEELVGFRLFNRTTRAISLTTDGAAFLPYAQQTIETLESGLSIVGGYGKQAKGILRMTIPGSFGRMHIVPILHRYQKLYPDVHLDLSLSDEVLNIVEGAFDLAIRNSKLSESSFIARKLAEDKRIIICSSDYIDKHGSPSTPKDLCKHPCINLTNNNRWKFENGELIDTPQSYVANDGEALRMMIENGMGIGMKSIWNAYKGLKTGKLVQVLEDFPLETKSSIWALYPDNRIVSPKVRSMIDFLLQEFQPIPPWEI